MAHDNLYPIPHKMLAASLLNEREYTSLYEQSISNPDAFWSEQAKRIHWFAPFSKVKNTSFAPDNVFIRWFEEGKTNASFNCLDRHLSSRGDQVAIYWEGDEPGMERRITYQQLHKEVCRCANTLRQQGIEAGDVVTVYMPMVIEAVIAMLACSRIGAIHSVVFAGFSAEALADRIRDCQSRLVITADESRRGGKRVQLKKNVDAALEYPDTDSVNKVLVLQHSGADVSWMTERDLWWHEALREQSSECPAKPMDSEDPLFILYTSGSTGKPKAILHTTGGYLVYAALTHRYVFNYNNGDIYWCNADVGWITGHTYITYGPLLNGATMIMHEGVFNYPTPNRLSVIIDKYKVNILYTAPTVIRALMALGTEALKSSSRESLHILGSVGEPINPEAWCWYYQSMGKNKCAIVDTWWQTETGGIMITPLPGITRTKPGSAARPFFGIQPEIVDKDNKQQKTGTTGYLVIKDSWPGQARTIYGDHQRFITSYFSTIANTYCTGDGAYHDSDGYYWITGRIDDVINVSGHRLSTAEIENSLASHPQVMEAAVTGFPHAIKGQGIYAYVVISRGINISEHIIESIKACVKKNIGSIAVPDKIQIVKDLPKTRSGKIMRRILRKIVSGNENDIGDLSTLSDTSIVEHIIRDKQIF